MVHARRLRWKDLRPSGWRLSLCFGHPEVAAAPDLAGDDPRARTALQRMIERGRDAPPVAALDGTLVQLAGFVRPLSEGARPLARFLLVPYKGACVHTPPPPPAKQAVLVEAATPLPASSFASFDADTDRAYLPRYVVF